MKKVTTLQCPLCGKTSEITMTDDQFLRWNSANRPHVQQLFPLWTNDQRELLITGTHPECWNEMFTDKDYDDE